MKKTPEGESKTSKAEASMVKELEPMKVTKMTLNLPIVILTVAIVIAGGFTGFVLSGGQKAGAPVGGGTTTGGLKKVVGVKDEKTFKDSAEGILKEGGTGGEGSHHLERPGGPSQNVYLTSSTIALDDYNGKKVKVFGETFAAAKAGWFMDVGRLELLE